MKTRRGGSRTGISRRTFIRGSAAVTAGLALSRPKVTTAAAASYVPHPNAPQYTLRVAPTTLNPDGKLAVTGVTANGSLPGPEIRARRGDRLRIVVENLLDNDFTSIHWHGLLVPAAMDGVPDISNAPIAAQRVAVYEYPLLQSGTYWYHSHWGFQEQVGLFGPLIIEEAEGAPIADRDAVVMISDWMHANPAEVFAKLRSAAPPASGDGMQMQPGMEMKGGMQMKEGTPMKGATPGGGAAPTKGMDMKKGGAKADLSDIAYDAFLLNGRSASDPWVLSAKPGERIRLRLINAGTSTYFRVRLDGHPLQITHADGMAVLPVTVDHLLIGMAESYDAVVTLSGSGSYTLHAVAQDGSGQAVGVLHTPDVSPTPNLDMPTFNGQELSYSALRATSPTTLPEGPPRTFQLPLQGDMARYVWMINGQAYPKADPLLIRSGERVALEMKNETMMWHPMHLHGHFFRLLQGAGELSPLKHTVNVAPGETVKIEFTADNPGRWFFHCHNLYHLEAGMARVFEYVV